MWNLLKEFAIFTNFLICSIMKMWGIWHKFTANFHCWIEKEEADCLLRAHCNTNMQIEHQNLHIFSHLLAENLKKNTSNWHFLVIFGSIFDLFFSWEDSWRIKVLKICMCLKENSCNSYRDFHTLNLKIGFKRSQFWPKKWPICHIFVSQFSLWNKNLLTCKFIFHP